MQIVPAACDDDSNRFNKEEQEQEQESPPPAKKKKKKMGKMLEKQVVVKQKFHSSPIALLPPHGYSRRDRFSHQCMQWIHIYEMRHPGMIVQSAMSVGGEKRVYYSERNKRQHYSLDGFYIDDDGGQKHALEFNGCYYHGCPKCYPHARNKTRVGNKTLSQRFSNTLRKADQLKELGFKVHTMWSCDFEARLLRDPQWRAWANEVKIEEKPLDLRDAYYGGRTNATVLQSERPARYIDFVSLYPAMMKKHHYPIGHPKRMTKRDIPEPLEVDCYATSPLTCPTLGTRCPGKHVKLPYMGIVKATILPPQNLLHPVLPYRCNGKLMFPLCRTCAEKQFDGQCNCSDTERVLTGTWCTPEVEVALSVGYKLVTSHEAIFWEATSDSLFTDYINQFLRIKAQASGWPTSSSGQPMSEEEKDEYIRLFEEREGIKLVKEEVENNPGLRTIAKLLLNSLYGKFAQRQNLKKNKFVRTHLDLCRMLSDPLVKMTDFHILHEDLMLVEYSSAKEFENTDPKTNVVISAFCSSFARLDLWRVMHSLGDRVLYHDTDSVIYTADPTQWEPPTGKCLGDLSDELTCQSIGCSGNCENRLHHITQFVACGPKNYAFRVDTGQTIVKVRGFSLNFDASKIINLDSMTDALHEWKRRRSSKKKEEEEEEEDQHQPLITTSTVFFRDKYNPRVYTKDVSKQYNVVYDKRWVLDDFTTRPFGFNDGGDDDDNKEEEEDNLSMEIC